MYWYSLVLLRYLLVLLHYLLVLFDNSLVFNFTPIYSKFIKKPIFPYFSPKTLFFHLIPKNKNIQFFQKFFSKKSIFWKTTIPYTIQIPKTPTHQTSKIKFSQLAWTHIGCPNFRMMPQLWFLGPRISAEILDFFKKPQPGPCSVAPRNFYPTHPHTSPDPLQYFVFNDSKLHFSRSKKRNNTPTRLRYYIEISSAPR